ncbi:MAG: ABC transporter permease subunit [Planctomycetota bacterium]
MAVNSLGYRGWSGKLGPVWNRIFVIARTGIRRAWSSHWLRRLLYFAWLPTLLFALFLFSFERSREYPFLLDILEPALMSRVNNTQFQNVAEQVMAGDTDVARHGAWAWIFQTFFRYPQGVTMALIVGLVTPPLISQDIRSRAFLLYFSRPINRYEYILGKLSVVWAYIMMMSTLPALVLYFLGILLSPNATVVAATWDIPIRIVIATAVLAIPTASLALCLSSLTQETRNATFAWFAIWIMGWVTFSVAATAQGIQKGIRGRDWPSFFEQSNFSLFSLYHTLGRVQSWVFGFLDFRDIAGSVVLLLAVTVISLVILTRRVVAPMNA